ncbi:MAG: hypothetical protein AAB375_00400 [Patescibacteria group bacterium]
MKKFLTYSAVVMLSLAAVSPALGVGLILPTPPAAGGPVVTGSGIVASITTIVNYFIVIATIAAVAMFIWGGVQYATGGAAKGGPILKQAAIGLLAILAVGLVINTISAFIGRGLNVG